MLFKKRRHIIVVGRVSDDTKKALIDEYGSENVIEAYVGKYKDEEAFFALFEKLDGGTLSEDEILEEVYSRELRDRELKGAHVTFVSSDSGLNVSARAMAKLFAGKFFKFQKGVASLTSVSPQMAFMRADRSFIHQIMQGEKKIGDPVPEHNAISCQSYAQDLRNSGFDRVIGITEHSRDNLKHFLNSFGYSRLRFPNIFNIAHPWAVKLANAFNVAAKAMGLKPNVEFKSTASLFAEKIREEYADQIADKKVIIGSPDGANKPEDFGLLRASDLREETLGKRQSGLFDDTYMFFIEKVRRSSTKTEITDFFMGDDGTAEGKTAFITDDVISSGSTLFDAAEKLKEKGAEKVIACITHAVLVEDAIEKVINNDQLDELWVTDTVPGAEERIEALRADFISEGGENDLRLQKLDKIKIVRSSPLIIQAINDEHTHHRLAFKSELEKDKKAEFRMAA